MTPAATDCDYQDAPLVGRELADGSVSFHGGMIEVSRDWVPPGSIIIPYSGPKPQAQPTLSERRAKERAEKKRRRRERKKSRRR